MGGAKFFQWKKLIGTIQSVNPAVPYADLFYRSLQGNRCKLTLPEPSCGSSPPSFEPSSSKVHLQSVLSYHLSGGTKSGYKCSYNKFVFLLSFSQCKSHHLWTYNNCSILEAIIWWRLFIQFCYFARSATSKYLSGYNGVSAGSHKLVTIACEAVFLYPNIRQLLT